MEQVGERFRVHEAVLDRDAEDLAIFDEWFGGIRKDGTFQNLIDCSPNPVLIINDLVNARPVRRPILRQSAINRIDAELEQPVELGIEGRHTERRGTDHVPVERFKMPKIKDDAMPLGNRPLVHRRRREHLKQLIRLRSSEGKFLPEAIAQLFAFHFAFISEKLDPDGKFQREIRIDVPVPPDAKPWMGATPIPQQAVAQSGAPWAVCITPRMQGRNPELAGAEKSRSDR